MENVVSDLETLAQGAEVIENRVLLPFLVRKLQNSKSFKDDNGVPEAWNEFDLSTFQLIVQNLDKHNTGAINWRHLATYLCLLKSPIPKQ